MHLTCFKSYDIRGRLGAELNEGVAALIGRAFGQAVGARSIVLGRDCRASSAALARAVAAGLREAGVDVLDLGLCGTEEVYFATAHLGADGGIEVTASHNPMDYNGMKLVKSGAAPLEPALLARVRALAESGQFAPARPGQMAAVDTRAAYVDRILSFVDLSALRPLKILVNPGNGTAGPTFDALAAALAARGAPLTFQRINHTPDGSFPNGIPNPLLPENQPATAAAVRTHGADLPSPGTAISTAASCLTTKALSFPANMSWACWRKPFSPRNPAPPSSTTRASSGIPRPWLLAPVATPSWLRPAMSF